MCIRDRRPALVTDDAPRKAGQDRASRPLRDVSDGGSGDSPSAVPGDPATDRTIETKTVVAGLGMTA